MADESDSVDRGPHAWRLTFSLGRNTTITLTVSATSAENAITVARAMLNDVLFPRISEKLVLEQLNGL